MQHPAAIRKGCSGTVGRVTEAPGGSAEARLGDVSVRGGSGRFRRGRSWRAERGRGVLPQVPVVG